MWKCVVTLQCNFFSEQIEEQWKITFFDVLTFLCFQSLGELTKYKGQVDGKSKEEEEKDRGKLEVKLWQH